MSKIYRERSVLLALVGTQQQKEEEELHNLIEDTKILNKTTNNVFASTAGWIKIQK